MRCKLCHSNNPTMAKAHIIPKSLYGNMLTPPSGPAAYAEADTESRPIRTLSGEYDRTILCRDCEIRLQVLDDHAGHVLMHSKIETRAFADPNDSYVIFHDANPIELNLFFKFLLWRMSATERPFFKNVRLGPFQDIIGKDLLSERSRSEEYFGVIITKFDTKRHGILAPAPYRIQDRNGYKLMLAGYSIWVQVDHRRFIEPLGSFRVQEGQSVVGFFQEYSTSQEFDSTRQSFRHHSGFKSLKSGLWKDQ